MFWSTKKPENVICMSYKCNQFVEMNALRRIMQSGIGDPFILEKYFQMVDKQ